MKKYKYLVNIKNINVLYIDEIFISLITMGKIKTTLRFHFIPVMMATIKKTQNNKCS